MEASADSASVYKRSPDPLETNGGALERSGQTLTAPCCDRVVGTASVYPVSRHQNRSRPVSITERGLVAEEPATMRKHMRLVCARDAYCLRTHVQGIQLFSTVPLLAGPDMGTMLDISG